MSATITPGKVPVWEWDEDTSSWFSTNPTTGAEIRYTEGDDKWQVTCASGLACTLDGNNDTCSMGTVESYCSVVLDGDSTTSTMNAGPVSVTLNAADGTVTLSGDSKLVAQPITAAALMYAAQTFK